MRTNPAIDLRVPRVGAPPRPRTVPRDWYLDATGSFPRVRVRETRHLAGVPRPAADPARGEHEDVARRGCLAMLGMFAALLAGLLAMCSQVTNV